MTALFTLNTLVLVCILIAAFLAVKLDNILSSVIALGVTGALVGLEFLMLHAPDVAISEVAVGAVLSTAIFVIAIARTTDKKKKEDGEE